MLVEVGSAQRKRVSQARLFGVVDIVPRVGWEAHKRTEQNPQVVIFGASNLKRFEEPVEA